MFKWSDFIATLIIGEAVAWFLLPVFKNIGIETGVFKYVLPVGMPFAALAGLYVFYLFSRFWRPVFFEIGKFASVGVLNTLIDFGILNLLSYVFSVHSGPLVALFNAISFSTALVNSYFWNKFWTFRSAGSGEGAKDFAQFVFVSLIGLGLNTGIVYSLTTLVGAPGGVSPALWENVAKAIAIPVNLTWNFLGYKFWVFKK